MTARTAADAGRRFALQQMVDTCTVSRPGGRPVLDPVTGVLVPPAGTTVYAGRCRLRTPTVQEATILFGEEQLTTTRYVLDVPHTVTGIKIADTVELDTTEDPDAASRSLRIVAATAETIYVMKSYGCEAVE